MNLFTKQNLITLVIVFGAVIFGMVLAGGMGLTPKGQTSPEPTPPAPAQAIECRPEAALVCRASPTLRSRSRLQL